MYSFDTFSFTTKKARCFKYEGFFINIKNNRAYLDQKVIKEHIPLIYISVYIFLEVHCVNKNLLIIISF